jgi:hypothetical protein
VGLNEFLQQDAVPLIQIELYPDGIKLLLGRMISVFIAIGSSVSIVTRLRAG